MSNTDENFESWHEPSGGGSQDPMEPKDKLFLYGKFLLVIFAEGGNWLLHTSNYALVNTVGSDLFVLDVLGLPYISGLSDISVNILINSILGLAAVAAPIFLFTQLLERHQEIFEEGRNFFKGLNAIVTALLVLLYLFVIATEFAAFYMRISEEIASSPIPDFSGNETSFWPMLIMAITLIITNACFGLATAHILRSTKRALRGK